MIRAPRNIPSRSTGGFTLVETLLALFILVLLTGIVAVGIPVAFQTYAKAVDGSNAQVLLGTTTTALRDELGSASDVEVVDGTLYYVGGDGYWASITNDENPGLGKGLVKHEYMGVIGSLREVDGSPQPLVPEAAVTDTLGITLQSITYDSSTAVFTVTGLAVANGEGSVLANVGEEAGDQFKIKAIMLEEE